MLITSSPANTSQPSMRTYSNGKRLMRRLNTNVLASSIPQSRALTSPGKDDKKSTRYVQLTSVRCLLTSTNPKPAYEDVRKFLPEGLKSTGLDAVLDSSYSSLIYSEEAPAVQAHQGLLPNEKGPGPIWQGGRNTSPTSVFRVSPSTTSLDPFFRLPRDISNRDKNLLHLCTTSSSLEAQSS